MNNNKYYALSLVLVVLVFGGAILATLSRIPKSSFGGAVVSSPVIVNGVNAVMATTTPQIWSVSEIAGSLSSTSTNSQVLVGATTTQLLAPNSGRVWGSVCNESALNGWISFARAAATQATSTGRLVPAGTCFQLSTIN